jgi:hypothetical protein
MKILALFKFIFVSFLNIENLLIPKSVFIEQFGIKVKTAYVRKTSAFIGVPIPQVFLSQIPNSDFSPTTKKQK